MGFKRVAHLALAVSGAAFAQIATVDFTSRLQEIDGFGASSAWHGVLNAKELDAAFSNGNQNQLGLSILRVDLDPAGKNSWGSQKTNATNAKARGVKYVLATPWSPPASMKTNNNTTGGELKTSSYAEYATYLKSYRDYMGDLVDVVSIQNEPNIKVNYVSCDWNATPLYNFVKNNASAIGGNVMMPETFNYDLAFSDPVLNDAAAAANISHIGLHLYGSTMKTYNNAVAKNKRIWMTEKYFDPDDIGTALTMAKEVMDCMNNKMNAYIWWYLRMPSCNLITSDGSIRLKGYVFGHFSKYVRPGAYHVTATYSPQDKVTVVAFTGAKNIVVAINQGTSAKTQAFSVKGAFADPKRYTTTSSKKLADDGTVAVNGGAFTLTLDAQSITTLVADASTGVDREASRHPVMVREGTRIMTVAKGGRIELRDLSGRVLRSAASVGDAVELDLRGLKTGVYLAVSGETAMPVSIVGP